MPVRLHVNATTTPVTRARIQASDQPVAVLAREFGVSETTIRRWRSRRETHDRSHRPHRVHSRFDAVEEAIAVELRVRLQLSLDDTLEVMRRCLRADVSRAGLYRCWQRHGVAAAPAAAAVPPVRFETDAPAGFLHLDTKQLTRLNGRRAYAYVAIDRATRFVILEVHDDRRAATGAAFLARAVAALPIPVHTVLTDNGGEWTDRFAIDKPGKPEGKPSGHHPVDKLCAEHGIKHQLARPFRPQTNGMVERFNRRLSEALAAHPANGTNQGKNRFASHAERNRFLLAVVHNYNHTRLRCLD